MTDYPVDVPDSVAAGTTLQYRRTLADYSSPTWALSLVLAGANVATATGVADSGGWIVTVAATATAVLAPGFYQWEERVTSGSLVFVVGRGTIIVTPNLATGTTGQYQSWAEKTLAALEASLAGTASADVQGYTVMGRALTHYSLQERLQMRNILKAELAAIKRGSFSRPVVFSFTGRMQP